MMFLCSRCYCRLKMSRRAGHVCHQYILPIHPLQTLAQFISNIQHVLISDICSFFPDWKQYLFYLILTFSLFFILIISAIVIFNYYIYLVVYRSLVDNSLWLNKLTCINMIVYYYYYYYYYYYWDLKVI